MNAEREILRPQPWEKGRRESRVGAFDELTFPSPPFIPPPTTTPSTYLIALLHSHSESIALLVSFSEFWLTLYTSLSLSSNRSTSSSRLSLLPSPLDLLSVGAAAMRRNAFYGKRADGSVQKYKAPRPYGQALVPLGRKASTQEQVSSASLPPPSLCFPLSFV